MSTIELAKENNIGEMPTCRIMLTPSGTPRFADSNMPWQQSLFELGARKDPGMDPVAAFWHALALPCVNYLCHAGQSDAPSPDEAIIIGQIPFSAQIPDSAPPMPGGEYLNTEALEQIWTGLLKWCEKQIRTLGGIAPFLEQYAPNWRQVGRVFFHLGENRLDADHPFAFLATYATGLNQKGQLRHTPLANALKLQAGNKQALARLLEPVYRASEKLPWVRGMCDSGQIFKPVPWKPDEAHAFLLSADELEQAGIGIRLPDWWKKRPRLMVKTEISTRDPALGVKALLDFDPRVALGDEFLDSEDLEKLLGAQANGLVMIKNQWVEADSEKLRAALDFWNEAKSRAARGELSFHQGMRMLAGYEYGDAQAGEIDGETKAWSLAIPGPGFREIIKSARDLDCGEEIPGLNGQLRPYQQKGVAWLGFMNRLGLGACLADDMGLGKTIQVISLLLQEKGRHKMPALLVAPASLMANWKNECARFAPGLATLVLHPSSLAGGLDEYAHEDKLRDFDLVITSYSMCSRLEWLRDIKWSRIIADEAQNIKNSNTRQSRAVRGLAADARIALTGTPIENSVGDLWAIFDFINPGLLGSAREFGELAKKMQNSATGFAPLRRLTAPYILRRMKTDKSIIQSLPEKTEMPLYCGLTPEQAKLYAQVVEKMAKSLEGFGKSADKPARNMLVLQNLTLLKQICNHPAQAGAGGAWTPERSGKFVRLGELCAEIASRQERALIFTQYREIIGPLSEFLEKIFGASGLALHGGTPVKKREELVKTFQSEDGPPFFILSLKAGGSGLNLTNANHVIHFDRWWNPAVENQATDRAYRIGQKKNVLVHKCLSLGTLEEKIDAMLLDKQSMADAILKSKEMDNKLLAMSDEQILKLVSLDASSIVE